ncbi:MAG: site-specific DNA-methyltransferase [Stigonema ocellatum SAG 48.90 = DSM 106950]|nr:site-specific DNA-methyltransferase [Stigonema ocellatum SAG 48.90 = DSM 106950]
MVVDTIQIEKKVKKRIKVDVPKTTDNQMVISGNGFDTSRPVYQSSDGRVSLHRNDAISFLKSLPDASIDLIVTDPAYSGMNQMLKLGRGKIIGHYKSKGEDGAKWFDEFHDTEENYLAFLQECHRVLKKDRHIYIMFDSFSLLSLAPTVRQIFDVKNLLCWDKANIGLGHYFRRRHEFIMFASKGKRPLNSKAIPDVWKVKRITSAKYPTQKPTEIYELMIKGSASKGFTVCDPFLGSGSAAIASLRNGCNFVGCDIAEKSLTTASSRVIHYMSTGVDNLQPNSCLADDELLNKLFKNGQSK